MTQWLILQSLLRDKNNFWHQIFNQRPFKLIKTISSHIHAWSGYDTTSAIHSNGRTLFVKKIDMSLQVRHKLNTLRDPNTDQLEVGVAGIELLLQMYGGNGSLANFR